MNYADLEHSVVESKKEIKNFRQDYGYWIRVARHFKMMTFYPGAAEDLVNPLQILNHLKIEAIAVVSVRHMAKGKTVAQVAKIARLGGTSVETVAVLGGYGFAWAAGCLIGSMISAKIGGKWHEDQIENMMNGPTGRLINMTADERKDLYMFWDLARSHEFKSAATGPMSSLSNKMGRLDLQLKGMSIA